RPQADRRGRRPRGGAPHPYDRGLSVPEPQGRRSRRAARGARPPLRSEPRALPAVHELPADPRVSRRHHRSRGDRGAHRPLPGGARGGEQGLSALLEVRNLRTSFAIDAGTFNAVDGVSFALEPGRTLGLVGESGCGKSVTALSIMGLIARPGRVAAGEIVFEGTNLPQLP